MKIRLEAPKSGVVVKFVEGALSKFTGSELQVSRGDKKPLPRRKMVILMRKVVSLAKQNRIKTLALDWKDIRSLAALPPKDQPFDKAQGKPWECMTDAELAEVMATAFLMANFDFTIYKQKPKDGFPWVEEIFVTGTPKEAQAGIKRGELIGGEVNACRDLANTPGKDMTPKSLVAAAQKALKGTKVKVRTLGPSEMKKLGMGAVLGVAQGAAEQPRFIVMEYHHRGTAQNGRGSTRKEKPIVLIGKGVTFDTGGLNVKTGDHMYEMHMDMSGGAAVIHAIALAARLGVKANIVGLIPAVENAISGSSIRPGDILRSLSGKTIEILNTDAEGRVILADGITYAKRYDPALVVDVATLTGAALVALGNQASAFMTRDGEDVPTFMHLAERSGDYLWPFPSWEEYEEMTKGTFGDVPNISTFGNSREGGVIAGGMFLKRFYDDLSCKWLHIDMAPRMTSAPNEFLSKGAAGAPVRFLLALAEHYAKQVSAK